MKKIGRKWTLLIIACCGILFLCKWIPNHKIVEKISADVLERSFSFGLDEGLYKQDIRLELSANLAGRREIEIYYTTDGSLPTVDSMKYTEPLCFAAEDRLRVIHLCANVYQNGEQIGGPYHGTWLLCKEPETLSEVLIVSITAEKEDLFGEERGILYPARSYVSANTEEKWNEVHAQNFAQKGELWVRPARVTVFEGNGKKVIDQDCGISVSGNHGSIMHYPFSLNLKADTSWQEGKNRFYYSFFGEQKIGGNGAYYDSISLKNSGNDYTWGELKTDVKGSMLRNTIGAKLAEETGLFVSKQKMALVFLNGEFYNLTYTSANLNAKTIAAKTGLDDTYVITKKYGEKEAFTQSGLKKLYHSFPDMTDSHIFQKQEEFESKVDVEELMRYYAFECIVGNADWPTKNYAMWCYIGDPQKENPYSDGRYRHWVFDLDCIYGLEDWLADPWDAIFGETNSENCLLPVLMQIEEYRNLFVNTVLDQLNSEAFQTEHIMELIDTEDQAYAPWFCAVYGEELEAERQKGIELFREKVRQRPEQVYGYLAQYFGVKDFYTLTVLPTAGLGSVKCNSIQLEGKAYTGIYTAVCPVKLEYEDSLVDTLDYWLVNGEKRTEKELLLTEDMIQNGTLTVQPVVKGKGKAEVLH